MKQTTIILLLCLLFNSTHTSAYDRNQLFGGWLVTSGDCKNTREKVLIRDSLIPVILDEKGCTVISGLWVDPYTAKVFKEPKLLDIDHIVPLKEAYESGANEWDKEQRLAIANDMDNLLVVWSASNRSKQNKDPSKWMPPNISFWTTYIDKWCKVKEKYNLRTDVAEMIAIENHKKIAITHHKGINITTFNIPVDNSNK